MAAFRNLKYPSYWRSRRDVECSVDAYAYTSTLESTHGGAYSVPETAEAISEIDDVPIEENTFPDDLDRVEESEGEVTCEDDFDIFFSGVHDCDSASSSSDDDLFSDTNLGEMLAGWIRDHNIPSTAVNSLLHILHRYHPGLPLESRTVLHTARTASIKSMSDGGTYSHVGIAKNLNDIFDSNPNEACFNCQQLKIQINVDGLPIFKSSSLQLWPILGILKGTSRETPFTVGIYCGNHKPCSVQEYLAEFTDEIKQLQHVGITLGDRQYDVSIHSFVCDAPARSFLKQTKLHSGYNACERCVQKGQWVGRVVYLETNAPLRTNVSFDELADESHHTGKTPLQGLGLGLVSSFCLDYMHLVCLGIMRKLLLMWMRGPLQYRISAGMLQQISDNLVKLRHAIPCEFARKPRTLYEIDRWKATEFRQFLLYTGPVVLHGFLSETVYKHFLLLSVSMYCCLRTDLCNHYATFVRDCLIQFVKLASRIYGEDVLVYNVHSVIHIVDDVQLFGPLDNISCFPFENHLRHMKKLIRRPSMPLQQLICRLSELDAHKSSTQHMPLCLAEKHPVSGPIPDSMKCIRSLTQYREFTVNGYKLKATLRDGVVLLANGEIVVIKNILFHDGAVSFVYQRFTSKRSLHSYPFQSSDVDVYIVSKLSLRLHTMSSSDIERKCVCMPLKDGNEYAVVPFAHKE